MRKRRHLSQSIEGALLNWNDRMWRRLAVDNGMNVHSCKQWFLNQYKSGVRVVPLGVEPCEGFDPQTGCPGHPILADL